MKSRCVALGREAERKETKLEYLAVTLQGELDHPNALDRV